MLLSGTLFLVLGALMSEPMILFIGQVQVAVLAVAFMLLVPQALALDRRQVRFRVVTEDDSDDRTLLVVGDDVETRVEILNTSDVTLHALRAQPFGAEAMQLEPLPACRLLPGRARSFSSFGVGVQRTGRWVLHGFDVRVSDPIGLFETRDYLPCTHPYEAYPRVVHQRRRLNMSTAGLSRREGGRHAASMLGMGTDVRELREHMPGDPLRHIAWKATVRRGKLISKNFEHESSLSVYFLLDASCSMRGGQVQGQKLEYAIEYLVSTAERLLKNRDAVGLMSFDEKLYGHVPMGSSPSHMKRLLHHLIGLSAVVDPDLTEFDEDEVEAVVADYLLIQERLDFRKGDDVDEVSGVNRKLLQRWLASVYRREQSTLSTQVLTEGIFEQRSSKLRRFAQLRGVDLPYRIEARLGMKERGLVDALERIVSSTRGRHLIVVVSDLCSIMNIDLLLRGLKLVLIKGHKVKFVVPFTPAFYQEPELELTQKYNVLKDLFTSAEREERMKIVERLRALGISVEFSAPR